MANTRLDAGPADAVHAIGGNLYFHTNSLMELGRVVEARPARLYGIHIYNAAQGARFVKVYNSAAVPTAAFVPALVFGVPGSSAMSIPITAGLPLDSGLSLRATTGSADNNAATPADFDVLVTLWYR